jgi:hypothetical protein
MGVSGQLHPSAALSQETAPAPDSVGGWVCPRAGLLSMPRIERRFHGRPTRSFVAVSATLSQLLILSILICIRILSFPLSASFLISRIIFILSVHFMSVLLLFFRICFSFLCLFVISFRLHVSFFDSLFLFFSFDQSAVI